MSTRWTMRRALLILVGSTLCTLFLFLGGCWVKSHFEKKWLSDEKYRISAIVQTGPEKEALKTAYLAELLDLSVDHALSLYAFDCKEGERKLLSSPLIRTAFIKRLAPSTIYIDYETRKPVAILADYKNTAIDREGRLFPVEPFFSPKEIPEIYLGLPPFGASEDFLGRKGGCWNHPIQNRFLELAFKILRFLETVPWKEGFLVKRIDVSNAFAPSLGQREVVLLTEEKVFLREGAVCIFPKILRFAPRDYAQQLNNFFVLRRNMEEDYRRQLAISEQPGRFAPRIIDLRIPQLAFIENRFGPEN